MISQQSLRKVKIVATLGPSSSSLPMITKMIEAGVNVFRLNFSHGTHDQHAQNIQWIRQAEKTTKIFVAILADFQGPKLRIGDFEQGSITLKEGQTFVLDSEDSLGNEKRVFFPCHLDLHTSLSPGNFLLLDDGKLKLEVTQVTPTSLKTKVVVGGILSNKKGVNIPNTLLKISAFTQKDQEDLKFLSNQPIDWVALSFVQKPEDLQTLKNLLAKPFKVMAKIEKPQALQSLAEIIELADGIMVARGDLGVECPPEHVPILQRKIIQECRRQGKPVIVATQMLESMIYAPVPTRAEASDVATAVYEGADAVMLSAESASGKYPLEAIEMLHRIIQSVEDDASFSKSLETFSPPLEHSSVSDGVTASAKKIAQDIKSPLIVTYTATGGTAIRTAHKRPPSAILAMTTDENVARYLNLVWGVYPCLIPHVEDLDEMIVMAKKVAKDLKFLPSLTPIIITCGVPFGTPGTTNIMCVETL
ncbi:MAG: pyruvate kinase [Alphaproteobacteria bacterium]